MSNRKKQYALCHKTIGYKFTLFHTFYGAQRVSQINKYQFFYAHSQKQERCILLLPLRVDIHACGTRS